MSGSEIEVLGYRGMREYAVQFDAMAAPEDAYLAEKKGKALNSSCRHLRAREYRPPDTKWLVEKATAYAKERVLLGWPIGQNQSMQFPIARAYAQMCATELLLHEGLRKYEANENCGEEAINEPMVAMDRNRTRQAVTLSRAA
tara:strand:- start:2101 stop:2529 length:429 start_codon:yes stop_codon:yes gene_type:complete